MRRKDREVKELSVIKQLVADCHVLRLAMMGEEYPYIVPVNYGYEWENDQLILFIHGARQGTKLKYLNQNNKVAIEIDTDQEFTRSTKNDKTEYSYFYRSLVGFGEALLVTELATKKRALQLIIQHELGTMPTEEISDSAIASTSIIEIRVREYTMKCHQPAAQHA